MIQTSIYGRLGRDPKAGTTKTGKPMVTASIAVDVGKSPEEEQTLWVTLLAFDRHAEQLQRHQAGDMVGAMGKLTRSKYTGTDGQERESWGLMVDALHSSRTVRPSGGKRQGAGANGQRQGQSARPGTGGSGWAPYSREAGEFDDELGF
jgi:single-strand DNA-binding protein